MNIQDNLLREAAALLLDILEDHQDCILCLSPDQVRKATDLCSKIEMKLMNEQATEQIEDPT